MPDNTTALPLLALKALGLLLAIAGLVLAIMPTLVHDPGPAASSFEAIERRIWWGALLGLGGLLLTHTRLTPWLLTGSVALFWIVGGILVARCIGLALDGYDSAMQWFWVAVEVLVIAAAAWCMKAFSQ